MAARKKTETVHYRGRRLGDNGPYAVLDCRHQDNDTEDMGSL